ncbi:hypothetical protein AcV7_008959 [Taiwanofungus camphoratus]|nr:hypothetical protein AcV7_008959 [Antrodia cinnamomea]
MSGRAYTPQVPTMDLQLVEHLDIPYLPSQPRDPLREFDLYVPALPHTHSRDQHKPPLICFVHGGAWRSEDKADHATLARRLAAHTRCPVALPNYRLTTPATPLRHPAHAADTLAFLHFLLDWSGPTSPVAGPPYDPAQLYLVGHSCSAHMLTSIFLAPDPRPGSGSGSDSDPDSPAPDAPDALAPSARLLAATRALVFSEGLYDLDRLLHTYPAYKSWFVAPAFGRRRSYAPWNTAAYSRRAGAGHVRWLVLHSRGDTLVDVAQSEAIWGRLREVYGGDGQEGEGPRKVERNWELTEEHNEMLAGEVYPRIVGDFVLADIALRKREQDSSTATAE